MFRYSYSLTISYRSGPPRAVGRPLLCEYDTERERGYRLDPPSFHCHDTGVPNAESFLTVVSPPQRRSTRVFVKENEKGTRRINRSKEIGLLLSHQLIFLCRYNHKSKNLD